MLNGDKTLNKNIPIPLYYQLKTILLEYIKNHSSYPDTPIPTELEISEHFGISRPTVRQAINELVIEGYLYRIKAKGTFITKTKDRDDFLQELDSFNNKMKKKGLTPSTKLLQKCTEKSDEKVSNALKVPLGTKVIRLDRLRYANSEPVLAITSYLPYAKCTGLMCRNLETESIYEILENRLGLNIISAARVVESIPAAENQAKLLGIEKGSPILYIESTTYIEGNIPIEFFIANYRGDRGRIVFELKRPT